MDSTRFSARADEHLIFSARQQVEAANQRALHRRTLLHLPGATAPATDRLGAAPEDFPGYDIAGEIHRGGQGVVYRAVHRATRREVAIKVLRGGRFATPHERIRLEREARILAQLRHPNVVTVHDSGVTDGHAYIVMDYIAGQPLDEYLRTNRSHLSHRALLTVFSTICDAVHAAHLRGVTHRDLKPANIRVNDQGQPYVLDFGLAKLTEPDTDPGSSEVLMTQTGQFVGSLPWAAPEQAAGQGDRIDLRTDVYSLGVVLYQLLTDRFPYPITGNPRETLEHISRTEPVPPRTLYHDIADDVETIVLKCLQKEPERRYQTAGELARDIRHYLADEPIDARRDSIGYVFRKQLRRHKLSVTVAVAFLLVVLVGFTTSAVLWRQAAGQRDAARTARDEESRQRELAETSAVRARTEEAKAQAVTTFLQQMLQSIDPSQARGRDVTVRDVLDEAATRVVGGELSREPEVDAQVRLTIGNTYLALGRYADAEPVIRGAEQIVRDRLGAAHPLMLRIQTAIGNLLFRQGHYADAEAAYRELHGELEAARGPDDPDLLGLTHSLGFALLEQNKLAEAEAILRPGLERARHALGEKHLTTLQTADTLGVVLRAMEKPEEAEALQRSATEGLQQLLGEEHPTTLAAMTNLAVTLRSLHEYPEAEVWLRRCLEIETRVLGEDHPQTLGVVSNLGPVLYYQGKVAEAEDFARRAVTDHRRVLPPGHPQTVNSEDNLAKTLKGLNKYDELAALLDELVTARRRDLGAESPDTIRVEDYRRDVLRAMGRTDELREFVTDLLARRRAAAERPTASGAAVASYAQLLLTCEPADLQDHAGALRAARRAVELSGGSDYLDLLAQACQANGDFPQAIAAQRAALAAAPPEDPHRRVVLEEGLADLLSASGDLAAAEAWLHDLVAQRRARAPGPNQDVEIALALLGTVLLDEQKPAEAEPVLRECLERRRDRLPEHYVLIPITMGQYGEALLQQERFAEAEPLLLESYTRLSGNPKAPPTRVQEARARLVRLYKAWGREDEAARWREQ